VRFSSRACLSLWLFRDLGSSSLSHLLLPCCVLVVILFSDPLCLCSSEQLASSIVMHIDVALSTCVFAQLLLLVWALFVFFVCLFLCLLHATAWKAVSCCACCSGCCDRVAASLVSLSDWIGVALCLKSPTDFMVCFVVCLFASSLSWHLPVDLDQESRWLCQLLFTLVVLFVRILLFTVVVLSVSMLLLLLELPPGA